MTAPALAAPRGKSPTWQQVLRDLPRDFAANLAHGLLGMRGFYLLAAPTFVPAYIYMMSDSNVAVWTIAEPRFDPRSA